MPSDFRELVVWQTAMELCRQVYLLARRFPASERFGLTSQIQRAAVSTPANIAEGNARKSARDYARFVSIASGSNAEVMTHLVLAESLGFVSLTDVQASLESCDRVARMLLQLHRALVRKLDGLPDSPFPIPDSRS
jgi:carbamoyl-phosphate synthase large subunit